MPTPPDTDTDSPQQPSYHYTDLDWFFRIQKLRCIIYEFPPDLFIKERDAHFAKALAPGATSSFWPSTTTTTQARPTQPIHAPTPVRHSSWSPATPFSQDRETRPNLVKPRTPVKSQPELDFIAQSPAIQTFRDVLTSRHTAMNTPDRPNMPGFADSDTEESFQVLDPDDIPPPSSSTLGLFFDDAEPSSRSNRHERTPGESFRRHSRSLQRAADAIKRGFDSVRQRVSPPETAPEEYDWDAQAPDGSGSSSNHLQDTSPVEFSTHDPNRAYFGFSNFSPHPVVYDGKTYPTGEHLHQSMKVRKLRSLHQSLALH